MSGDWIARAKVGDRVVCIDDRPFYSNISSGLKAGEVYEISAIGAGMGRSTDGTAGYYPVLGLVGYVHPRPKLMDVERGNVVGAHRFRPAQTRRYSIQIFTDMLKTTSKPIKETV